MSLLNNKSIITQSNKLIESRYTLTLSEQRVIFAMISMINPEDEDFVEYKIRVSDLAKVIGLKGKDFYSQVQQITKDIINKTLQIKQDDGILQINWISSAKYIDDQGIVKLTFDPKLKPYLLQLKQNFTSTKLGIIVKFRSFFTNRIYYLAKQYQKIGERVISVAYLKEIFPQYQMYKDIKRRVILPAQKEINDKSDIRFDFKEIKVGRKVKEIVFYNIISQSYAQELPLVFPVTKKAETIPEIIHRKYRVDIDVASNLFKKIISEDEKNDFEMIFRYIDAAVINGNIKNLPGYVVNCLSKGYYKNKKALNSVEVNKFSKEFTESDIDNNDSSWKKIRTAIKNGVDKEIFDRWLIHLNFVELANGKLTLVTTGKSSKFYKDWIKREYMDEYLIPIVKDFDNSIEKIIINITK